MKNSILFSSLVLSFVAFSAVAFSNSALAAEPKFLKPVTCKTDSGDLQVKINPDGKLELTGKDKTLNAISFQECRFVLSGVVSVADKLPNYICSTEGLASRYRLAGSNSGVYNLMEMIQVYGKWSLNNSSKPVDKEVRSMERSIGTFTCSDPTFDAWVDAENNARGHTTAPQPARK